MSKRRLRVRSNQRYWWIPDRLNEHFSKHGKEVALARAADAKRWTTPDYEYSSSRTILSSMHSAEFRHVKDDLRTAASGYSIGSSSLISIVDAHNNRIRTHFPLGAYGEKQCQRVGALPPVLQELHALRSLYNRIRCGLYISKNSPINSAEKYLGMVIAKELQCCAVLGGNPGQVTNPDDLNWLKVCLVSDWINAKHFMTDKAICDKAESFTREYEEDNVVIRYAENELNTVRAAFVGIRLLGSETLQLPNELGDNAWTFTESFLHVCDNVCFLQQARIEPAHPTFDTGDVVECFASYGKRLAVTHAFKREVACYLQSCLRSVKWFSQTPSYQLLNSVLANFSK